MIGPTANVEVVKLALPLLSCADPSTVFPAEKVTGPVAATVGDVTVAVKVTDCPKVEGFGGEVSVVELVVGLITWFKGADVLGRLLASAR